ncbi:hypothetical protein ACWCW7_33805 [Nocardia tengchongensis]
MPVNAHPAPPHVAALVPVYEVKNYAHGDTFTIYAPAEHDSADMFTVVHVYGTAPTPTVCLVDADSIGCYTAGHWQPWPAATPTPRFSCAPTPPPTRCARPCPTDPARPRKLKEHTVNKLPANWKRLDTDPPLDLRVEVICDTCGETWRFWVNRARFTAWSQRRMLLQDAFAHLSCPDREFIKDRTCPSCWTKTVGPNPFA